MAATKLVLVTACAEATSNRVKLASLAVAERVGRPVQYRTSPKVRKDELAREIAKRDAIDELICVVKTIEPLLGFSLHRNREAKELELRMEQLKCLHLYHYVSIPCFGFMHVRMQTCLVPVPGPDHRCIACHLWAAAPGVVGAFFVAIYEYYRRCSFDRISGAPSAASIRLRRQCFICRVKVDKVAGRMSIGPCSRRTRSGR